MMSHLQKAFANGVKVTAFLVDHGAVKPAFGYRVDYQQLLITPILWRQATCFKRRGQSWRCFRTTTARRQPFFHWSDSTMVDRWSLERTA